MVRRFAFPTAEGLGSPTTGAAIGLFRWGHMYEPQASACAVFPCARATALERPTSKLRSFRAALAHVPRVSIFAFLPEIHS